MKQRKYSWGLAGIILLSPLGAGSMIYPRSLGAVIRLEPGSASTKVRGTIELNGVPAAEVGKLLRTARVHGTPAGRDKRAQIRVSDNSMDVVTPSADGTYALMLDKQELWLIEATADGFETAVVVVSGSAVVDFVLIPRARQN